MGVDGKMLTLVRFGTAPFCYFLVGLTLRPAWFYNIFLFCPAIGFLKLKKKIFMRSTLSCISRRNILQKKFNLIWFDEISNTPKTCTFTCSSPHFSWSGRRRAEAEDQSRDGERSAAGVEPEEAGTGATVRTRLQLLGIV